MLQADLNAFVQKNFPIWKDVFTPDQNIVSEEIIEIPKATFTELENIVKAFYHLRDNKDYVTDILKTHPGLTPQPHYSVLMSFDFHIVNDRPKLIEINTNASFALLAFTLDQYKLNNNPEFLNDLKNSFETDYKLFSDKKITSIAIVDENPTEQKAYFEFLMYQKLFESWGWKCDILDVSAIKEDYDFIYNRHTDFYLNLKQSKILKSIYENKKSCISPHPTEYALLADKMLFFKFAQVEFLKKFISAADIEVIQNCLPKTQELNKSDPNIIWENKKNYIFKPKNSFGGKAVYPGQGLTKNKFEEIKKSDYLVQEYIPAPKHNDLKWDLRCYVYRGKIQLSGARAYRGQITNFKERGGGFARIRVV